MRLRIHLAEGTSEWESNETRFRIGRGDSCALRFEGEAAKYASWEHAEFHVNEHGGVYVTDLASSNGTYVDGRRIAEATPLWNGVTVQIGTRGPRMEVLDLARRAPPQTPLPVPPVADRSAAAPPGDIVRHLKTSWPQWAVAIALGLAMLATVGFLSMRKGAAPQADEVAQAPDPDGKVRQPQDDGDKPLDPPESGDGKNSPDRSDPELIGGQQGVNVAKPPPPPDPLKLAKDAGLAAYRLIAVEDPKTQSTRPYAGAAIVAPRALLTTADVGVELARFIERGWRVKAVRDSQDAGVRIDRVRIHAAFQNAEPEQQLFFEMAVLYVTEHLGGAATQASPAELAAIDNGQPLLCVATSHSGDAFNRFDELRPEVFQSKVFAVRNLSPDAGAPRLLFLRGAFGENPSGSPIFNDRGHLVAVYCEAAPVEEGAPQHRATHYAAVVEPQLVAKGLTREDNQFWAAPVVTPDAAEKKEPGK